MPAALFAVLGIDPDGLHAVRHAIDTAKVILGMAPRAGESVEAPGDTTG